MQREPRGAVLAAHRPEVGLPRQGALRVDHQGELLVDQLLRGGKRLGFEVHEQLLPAVAESRFDLARGLEGEAAVPIALGAVAVPMTVAILVGWTIVVARSPSVTGTPEM